VLWLAHIFFPLCVSTLGGIFESGFCAGAVDMWGNFHGVIVFGSNRRIFCVLEPRVRGLTLKTLPEYGTI
jgi:hypothetical protein